MSLQLRCKFCHQNCFEALPLETPPAMREAFERHQRECRECHLQEQAGVLIATCQAGQHHARVSVGYAWSGLTSALTILKLAQALQMFLDKHGRNCTCPECSFAQGVLWQATEKGVLNEKSLPL